MHTFKEYMKERTFSALEREYFDISGNSPVAQYNKSYFQRMGYAARGTFRDVKYVVQQPVLEWSLGDIFSLLLVALLFPVIIVVSPLVIKSRAIKELKVEYRKSLIDKMHR